jgi:hypothetical protein
MKRLEHLADAPEAAADLIRSARHLTAFTGAGISVESGIPPFRGAGGLWDRYDPRMLELDYFLAHPETAWPVIKEIFYDNFGKAKPNAAHLVLARLEAAGTLKVLITQNIDNLHHIAGSERLFWWNHRKTCSKDTRSRLQPRSAYPRSGAPQGEGHGWPSRVPEAGRPEQLPVRRRRESERQ